MSRSGYRDYDDGDANDNLRQMGWAANVRRCIAGRVGQAFLWELYLSLGALPKQELITGGLIDSDGACCSLGAVALRRGKEIPPELRVNETEEPEDYELEEAGEAMIAFLDVKDMLGREIMFENDEHDNWHDPDTGVVVYGWPCKEKRKVRTEDTPHERWLRMRRWCVGRLRGIP
jgi:hypothetical protein